MPYLYNQSPRWIDSSGLPEKLNQSIHPCAWSVFKRLMELDYLSNPEPDVFDIPLERLSAQVGMDVDVLREILTAFIENGYLESYLPETDEEPAFFRITTPVKTPMSPRDILVQDGGLAGTTEPLKLRYYDPPMLDESADKFKQILHLYFDLCGLKLNSSIVDDLKEIERTFELDAIKASFLKAKRNKIRSLRGVFKLLYGVETKKKSGKDKHARTDATPSYEELNFTEDPTLDKEE